MTTDETPKPESKPSIKEQEKAFAEKLREAYNQNKRYITIILIIIIVWMIWSLNIRSHYFAGGNGAKEDAGLLGDSYGAITSFFSALAFAGIAITIYLQRKELTETRREFVTQNATLKRQRFESTFFNMLSIHFKIKEKVDGIISARVTMFIGNIPAQYLDYKPENLDTYKEAFKEEVLIHLPILSQHLQSLVSLHQLIKNNKFKPEVENRYLDILSNYISIPEKQLLYYFAVLANETDLRTQVFNFAPDLIFNLTTDYIAHESHINLYPLDMEIRQH